MACVAVLTGNFSAHELSSAGAIDVVDSVADLLGWDWTAGTRR